MSSRNVRTLNAADSQRWKTRMTKAIFLAALVIAIAIIASPWLRPPDSRIAAIDAKSKLVGEMFALLAESWHGDPNSVAPKTAAARATYVARLDGCISASFRPYRTTLIEYYAIKSDCEAELASNMSLTEWGLIMGPHSYWQP